MTKTEAAADEAAKLPNAYPLKYPFDLPDGTQLTELKLRRAKAKDIIALETAAKEGRGNAAVTLAFLGSVNGLSVDELSEIDAEDLLEVSELVVGFLPKRLLQGLEA